MSIDDVTTHLRGQLQEAFGVDGATYLMDRPPGGWSDLVTNVTLRLELRALSAELRAEIGSVRSELGAEIGSVRSELGAEIGSVRSEIAALGFELRAEMHQGFRDQTWRLMTAMLSSMAVLVAVMVAAIRL